MSEPTAEVIVNLPLPCGCVVSQKYAVIGTVRNEEEAKLVLQFGADRLKLWAEQRCFNHKCQLPGGAVQAGSLPTRSWREP